MGLSLLALSQWFEAETQRFKAEHQAAEAQKQRTEAERQRAEAERQQTVAERNAAEADRQRTEAEKQKREAEIHRMQAEAERNRAQKAESAAQGARQRAEESESKALDHQAMLAALTFYEDPTRATAFLRTMAAQEANKVQWRGLAYHVLQHPLSVETRSLPAPSDLTSYTHVSLDRAGRGLIAASNDGGVTYLALTGDGQAKDLGQCRGEVRLMALTGAKHRAAVGLKDGKICVWDVDTAALLWKASTGGAVLSLALSPDGRRLASTSWDGESQLWDIETGQSTLMKTTGVSSVAFSADGLLVTASDEAMTVWDSDLTQVARQDIDHPALLAVFSPGGSRLVYSTSDPEVWSWRWRAGEAASPLGGAYNSYVVDAAFIPRGPIATKTVNKALYTVGGTPIHRQLGASIVRARAHSEEPLLVSASDDRLGQLWRWRADGATERWILRGHSQDLLDIGFVGDQVVTISAEGVIRFWPTTHQTLSRVVPGVDGRQVEGLGLTEGTEQIVVQVHGRVRTWRVQGARVVPDAGGEEMTPEAPLSTRSEISPDGGPIQRIVGRTSGVIEVTMRDGELPFKLIEHFDAVRMVASSVDGRSLLTASSDGTVRLWQLPTDEKLHKRLQDLDVCISVEDRIQRLGESEREATDAFDRCEASHP